MGAITFAAGLFVLLFFSIFAHELGHIVYFNEYLDRKIRITLYFKSWRSFGLRAGEFKDYLGLTARQKVQLNLFGIIGGMIPIFFAIFFLNGFYAWMLLPYLAGCRKDFQNLERLRKCCSKS